MSTICCTFDKRRLSLSLSAALGFANCVICLLHSGMSAVSVPHHLLELAWRWYKPALEPSRQTASG